MNPNRRFWLLTTLFACFSVTLLTAQTLLRGPYLQNASPTAITLRWRTQPATVGVVRYGTSPNRLTQTAREAGTATDHTVSITGLAPNTRYYYAVGTGEKTLAGSREHFFYTFPSAGQAKRTRIWALGDFGDGSTRQQAVKRAFREYVRQQGDPYIDLWLWLGDNAYGRGLDTEFQRYVFSADTGYAAGRFMKQTPIFATPGNHDYAGDNARRLSLQIPYYDIVTHPTRGEAGGVASGTESYYSFNYGNIHFVSLDSDRYEDSTSRANRVRFPANSPQLAWLKADLTAAQQDPNRHWTIVFWHHPPYTKGTHDSDTEKQLRDVRQNLLPVLEEFDVDVVLGGHSHVYERSGLLRGHYGDAATFDAARHVVRQGTGQPEQHYAKPAGPKPGQGTIYVVNGGGGAEGGHVTTGPSPWPLRAMATSYDSAGGSMLLDVADDTLTATFIAGDGSVRDHFTLQKPAHKPVR